MSTKTLKWALGAGVALAAAVILVRTVAQLRSDPSNEEEEEEKREEAIKPPSRVAIQNGQALITLDAETQSRAGIAIAPLKPITARGQVAAPAVVLSAQELVSGRNNYVAALARLGKARAIADVAQQEYDRLKILYQDDQNASRKAFQAAEGALRSDQAEVQAARQDLTLQAAAVRQSWGRIVAKWIADDAAPSSWRPNQVRQIILRPAASPISADFDDQDTIILPDHGPEGPFQPSRAQRAAYSPDGAHQGHGLEVA